MSWLGVSLAALAAAMVTDQAAASAPPPGSPGHPLSAPTELAQFPNGFPMHGVAGDRALLFAVQPADAPNSPRGVHVARRRDGALVGDLPAPPEGFGTPLSLKIEDFIGGPLQLATAGTFVLSDNRVPPGLAGTQATRIYQYGYTYDPKNGLKAYLLDTHVLPLNTFPPGSPNLPNGLVYSGSMALIPQLGGDLLAITDNATGSVWVSDANYENWRMALIDMRFAGQLAGPITGKAILPDGTEEDYTLLTPAPPGVPPEAHLGLYPGAHSITYAKLTDEVCFAVTTPGGLYCIKRADLLNTALPPWNKTANPTQTITDLSPGKFGKVRQVVSVTHGLGDLTDGLDYDRFAAVPGPWLYWQRAPADLGPNTLRRVNLLTGQVQVVAEDYVKFAWANEVSALPPILPGSPLTTMASSFGQEFRNPDVNRLLPQDQPGKYQPTPFVVTLVSNQ